MIAEFRQRNNTFYSRLLRVSLFALVCAITTGCSGSLSDLEAWVEEVKARPQQGIEPLPEILPYKAFAYASGTKRDPSKQLS